MSDSRASAQRAYKPPALRVDLRATRPTSFIETVAKHWWIQLKTSQRFVAVIAIAGCAAVAATNVVLDPCLQCIVTGSSSARDIIMYSGITLLQPASLL